MKLIFDNPGCNFEACREAEAWCENHDIAYGAMERDQPRGLMVGGYVIAKWSNLRPHERATLDGKMTGNMLSGPVVIELKGEPAGYPFIESRYADDNFF